MLQQNLGWWIQICRTHRCIADRATSQILDGGIQIYRDLGACQHYVFFHPAGDVATIGKLHPPEPQLGQLITFHTYFSATTLTQKYRRECWFLFCREWCFLFCPTGQGPAQQQHYIQTLQQLHIQCPRKQRKSSK